MKRIVLFTALLALTAPFSMAQASSWSNDQAHSEVDFTILHLGISKVHGRFGHVTADVELNEADVTKSSVQVSIDVAGVETGEDARDKHLKTDAFFDVAKFPTATFTSTSVAKSGSGLTIAGNLTLHGVTKPVTLQVDAPMGPLPGMDKKPHTGYEATTTISRSAFGIGTSFPTAVLGDEVKLTIELDTVKK